MPIIATNGIKLAYEVQGDPNGEVVLLIAGLALPLTSWPEGFCNELVRQGFRVVRFDNRDSGKSSRMQHFGQPHMHQAFFKSLFRMPWFSGYTLYDMARDAIGLLDGLGIDHAHVVGASMGGMIAQIMAARYPHRVSTLTSIMSTSGRPGLPGPTLEASQAMFSRPVNARDVNSVIDHYVHLFQVIGSPTYPTPESVLRPRVAEVVKRGASFGGTARQMMAVASSGDLVAQLRTIKLPSLIIHGTEDPLVPIDCGRDCASHIPNAVMHEVEGMGHDIPPALEQHLARLVALHCGGGLQPEARRA